MAVCLSVPLGCDGTTDAESTAAYVAPTPDGAGCRVAEAAYSPVAIAVASRGEDPAPGAAGRMIHGFHYSMRLKFKLRRAYVLW